MPIRGPSVNHSQTYTLEREHQLTVLFAPIAKVIDSHNLVAHGLVYFLQKIANDCRTKMAVVKRLGNIWGAAIELASRRQKGKIT